MMINLYNIKCLDESNGETYSITIPAQSITKAFLEVQMAFPKCTIISCSETGKAICEDGWLNVFADYLLKRATVKDIEEFTETLGSEYMREELVSALWKARRQRRTSVCISN